MTAAASADKGLYSAELVSAGPNQATETEQLDRPARAASQYSDASLCRTPAAGPGLVSIGAAKVSKLQPDAGASIMLRHIHALLVAREAKLLSFRAAVR